MMSHDKTRSQEEACPELNDIHQVVVTVTQTNTIIVHLIAHLLFSLHTGE